MEDTAVIETHELSKQYGSVTAVDGLSFQVPRGQVFGLLGPNGSGKTTTIAMLLGLVKPSSGTMRLFGLDAVGGPPNVLSRVGALMETPAFYPYLSGRANLQYFQGISQHSSPHDVDHLLELVRLSDHGDSKFSIYSLGMKHRLGIAYALLSDPELLLLDEPTNGLDPAGMVEVRDLIRDLGTGGRTVLLCSHLLNEVQQVCDSVAILSHGRLIAQGSVSELLRQQDGVRLRTSDDAKAAEVIGALSWIDGVGIENGYLVVTTLPERSWELTRALSEQGVYVSELAQVRGSLARIHRRRASGQCPEAARGCSCESGIMVLKQQSRPQNKEHPIDATTQPSRSHPNRV